MTCGAVYEYGDNIYFQLGELENNPKAPFVPLYIDEIGADILLSCDEVNNRYFIHPQTGIGRFPHFGMVANLKFARLIDINIMKPFLSDKKFLKL